MHEFDGIGVLQIACGETMSYALCNDTNVYSAGVGLNGQLGHQDMVHEKLKKFRKVNDRVARRYLLRCSYSAPHCCLD